MKKVFNILSFVGITSVVASCGTSEQFIQDDVYSVRTPMIPPGTDLTDVTDYAAYVAKKEQTREKTIYTSNRDGRPGDFYDPTFRMMYMQSPYGFGTFGSPYYNTMYMGSYGGYGMMNYISFNRHFNPYYFKPYGSSYPYYSGHGQPFMGYYSPYYPPYNYYPAYFENSPFAMGMPGGYGYYGYGFGGYGGYGYGGNNFGYGGFGHTSGGYYTPSSKPKTPGNMAHQSAGSSAGRYGSNSNGQVVYHPNQLSTGNTYTGVGRNTDKRDATHTRIEQASGTNGTTDKSGTVRPTTGRVIEATNRQTETVRPTVATDRSTSNPTISTAPGRTTTNGTFTNERVVRPAGTVSNPRTEGAAPVRPNTGTPGRVTGTPSRTYEPANTSPGRTVSPTRQENNTISTPRSTSPTIRSTPSSTGGGASPARSTSTPSGGRR